MPLWIPTDKLSRRCAIQDPTRQWGIPLWGLYASKHSHASPSLPSVTPLSLSYVLSSLLSPRNFLYLGFGRRSRASVWSVTPHSSSRHLDVACRSSPALTSENSLFTALQDVQELCTFTANLIKSKLNTPGTLSHYFIISGADFVFNGISRTPSKKEDNFKTHSCVHCIAVVTGA